MIGRGVASYVVGSRLFNAAAATAAREWEGSDRGAAGGGTRSERRNGAEQQGSGVSDWLTDSVQYQYGLSLDFDWTPLFLLSPTVTATEPSLSSQAEIVDLR